MEVVLQEVVQIDRDGKYIGFISFYWFSTEELRLATGTSAPVARKKNEKECSNIYIYIY